MDGGRPGTALLTLARRLGPPMAVLCGPPDEATVAALSRFGSTTVCSVSCTEFPRYPIATRVEALTAIAGGRTPAMGHATTVTSVDRDPAAPIFDVADPGVVGNLHEVVPALLAEIRTRHALSAPIPVPARRNT